MFPLAFTWEISFTSWKGIGPQTFVGLNNYVLLFKNDVFYIALTNNIVWAVLFAAIATTIGLLFAGAIDLLSRRRATFFRTMMYLTVLLPALVVSTLFLALYDPNIGLINATFNAIGLTILGSVQWLGNFHLTLYSVLASSIWQYAPWAMLLFIAAFAGVSPSLIEAARVDGASNWDIFWRIKVPIIRPVILIVVALSWIWNSMAFPQIWTMTQGGPGYASEVLTTYLYQLAFSGLEFGPSSALVVILFILIFPVVAIFVRMFEV